MHDVRVVLTGEYESRTPHIGGELIHFVTRFMQGLAAHVGVPEITDYEVIS